MESKQEMLEIMNNDNEIMNNVAVMTLMTMCFGSFLFLVHLSGQPGRFYHSHHLSCHLDFMFYVLFSPTYPLLGKFMKTL